MRSNFQSLPDPEISLRDSRDFLISNPLSRLAFKSGTKNLSNFVSDLIEAIYRLVQSCHLPEFTDHGLPHLCSLIDRICRWELKDGAKNKYLVEQLSANEAAILLVATLIHDLGMLSQNPIDLPEDISEEKRKPNWSDVSNWVRVTHVDRLEKLVRRVMNQRDHQSYLKSKTFSIALSVAKSHQQWPWQWSGSWMSTSRSRGLAAVVAVSDLLDEDSARCDTTTLLHHREGTHLNKAHWLRHALTTNRILIERGQIKIEMVRPPGTTAFLRPVFSALRNHFRLVMLYEKELANVGADISNVDLVPSTGTPPLETLLLHGWDDIHGFGTENAFCFQLLRTFMPEAVKDLNRCDGLTNANLRAISLEDVDISHLEKSRGLEEPRTEIEQNFAAF